jgi:hypothetical protein
MNKHKVLKSPAGVLKVRRGQIFVLAKLCVAPIKPKIVQIRHPLLRFDIFVRVSVYFAKISRRRTKGTSRTDFCSYRAVPDTVNAVSL